MKPESIKMDGASFHVASVLSFESEKAFIAWAQTKVWTDLPESQRKNKLKTIWKLAKKQS